MATAADRLAEFTISLTYDRIPADVVTAASDPASIHHGCAW